MRYPVELVLAPSRRAVMLIAAIHGLAAIAFLYSSLPWGIVLAALALLGFSLRAALRSERGKDGMRLVLEDAGGLRTADAGPATPRRGCADFGWAVWLQWRRPGGGGALMLWRDNVTATGWRTLRTWLRHKAFSAEEPPRRAD